MNSTSTYYTLKKSSQGEYKEKGSKFIAYAFAVADEEEAKTYLEALQKEHFKSRHVCFAWRVDARNVRERANDDGEPANSAGQPILRQIQKRELVNVLVAVVRYFGGTKLGVGGLMNAYKTAAEAALEAADIVEKEITAVFSVNFSYNLQGQVLGMISEFNASVKEEKFTDICSLKIEVREDVEENLLGKLAALPEVNILR